MTGKLAVRSKDSWGWRDMQETFSVSNSATSVFVSSGEIILGFKTPILTFSGRVAKFF
jgi:hypothetical protein